MTIEAEQTEHSQSWQVQDRFLELHSRWMTLIGEHLQDDQGNLLEYWRIEKADSVIVLPIYDNCILLPSPSYRPGVGQATLDFPGGRIAEGQNPEQAAIDVLKRELGIEAAAVMQLSSLNPQGWMVNSSFSNQKLYGFIAQIDDTKERPQLATVTYTTTLSGIQELLQHLTCLQCRTVLLEYRLTITPYSNISN